ncbi:MAG: hypothetical protein ACREAK_07050 [Nitrosarchaeum sp.]
MNDPQHIQTMMNDSQYMQKISDLMKNNPQMMQHMMNLMNGIMMGSNMTHNQMMSP